MTDTPVLEVDGAVVTFSGLRAVDGISFAVSPGEMFGIIGPNGAGKTTLLNAISGLLPLRDGVIRIDGREVQGRRPDQITLLGLGRTFQAAEVFNDFRVIDYLLMGRFIHQRKSLIGAALRLPVVTRPDREDRRDALKLLSRFNIAPLASESLKELPYGLRKLVDLLRALFGNPHLLLLDEPTSGTATEDRKVLREALSLASTLGVTVVVVDHDVQFVTDLCHRILAMNFGRELGMGSPSEVLSRPDVLSAYVGMETDEG
jgi:branched-chain amino acid transport system ATP-binding protein